MKSYTFIWLLFIVSLLIAAISFPFLPQEIVVHWNLQGEPDDTMPKLLGIGIFPLLIVGLGFLLHFLPNIDPKKKNYASFKKDYNKVIYVFLTLLLFVQLLITISFNHG